MDRYPKISDHGIIGDLQTAALVSTDGTVDFFCLPRFDSPSVFASLLGRSRRRLLPDLSGRRQLRGEAALLSGHHNADHPVRMKIDLGGDTDRRRQGLHLREWR